MGIAPAALVLGAPRLPLPYGLFSAFSMRPAGDRWESGIQWETLTTEALGGIGEPICDGQRITTGGVDLSSFTLTFDGDTTQSLDDRATAEEVQAELVGLDSVGEGNVEVYGPDGGPWLVVFQGDLEGTSEVITSTPTGGTGTVTVTQVSGTAPGLPKDLGANGGGLGTASPFTVYGHFTCSPVGFSPEMAQDRATQHLLAREEARVEQAFWTGDLLNDPNLAESANDLTPTPPGTAVSADAGIAALENFVAGVYGSLGVVHMTRGAASVLLARDRLVQTGSRLTTGLGTPVVAGAGYPGTSPAGADPGVGETWVYVTPALFGYRSEVFTSSNRSGDLFDRATNDLYAVAERTYLLGFDPLDGLAVGAVLLSLED